MNRILKYYKNRKGITLVLMAFMLAVLLMLAGLAIDIAYMYYVKNQLQVAADASALAGAARLNRTIDNNITAFGQMDARQEAWKFACKNRAAGQSVFLVINSSLDCNAPPASVLNETSNTSTEDIVVGHWRSTTPPSGVTCEPAGSGYFCPATGSTGLQINALQARPRRTNETPGMPRVSLFIGQIFSLIGADWSAMSARAEAIAAKGEFAPAPIPICLPSCTLSTPLETEPWTGKRKEPDSNKYPGIPLFLNPAPAEPGFAWTNFASGPDCAFNCGGGNQPDPKEIIPYITSADEGATDDPPPICNKYICTTQATMAEKVEGALEDRWKEEKEKPEGTITFSQFTPAITVKGWKTFVPVVEISSCGRDPNQACPGDPKGSPYLVTKFAEIVITYVGKIGEEGPGQKWGMKIIGLNDPQTISGKKVAFIGKKQNGTHDCDSCASVTSTSGAGVRLVR